MIRFKRIPDDMFNRSVFLFVVFTVLLVFRSWNATFYPILGHEDGRNLFALYRNQPGLSHVFRFYGGYISLFSSIIATIAGVLPHALVPYVFSGISIMITAVMLVVLSLKTPLFYEGTSRSAFLVACCLYLLPLGKSYMITNLTYSQWNLLFILIVLLCIPTSEHLRHLLMYSGAMIVCAISNPLSLLTIPLFLIRWFLAGKQREKLPFMIGMAVLMMYQFFGVQNHPSVKTSIESLVFTGNVYFTRVIAEVFIGARITTWANTHGFSSLLALTGFAVFLAMSAFCFLR